MINDIPKKLSHFDILIDGRSMFGKCEEITLPVPSIKTADYVASGYDAPLVLDQGMEKLECNIVMAEYDNLVMQRFMSVGAPVSLIARGALTSQGISGYISASIRGQIIKLDMGTWKPGETSSLSVDIVCSYYRLEMDGAEIMEIDVPNMIRRISGVDQLAMARAAILK